MMMKVLAVILAALVVAVVGTVTVGEAQEVSVSRVAVLFEGSVRDRQILEVVVQEALRASGYQPVVAERSRYSSARDLERLEGVDKVLIVAGAKVLHRQRHDAGAGLSAAALAALTRGQVKASARFAETIVSFDAKMVSVSDRSVISFGHGQGVATSLERLNFSGLILVDGVKPSGLYRGQTRRDMIYEAAKRAATEAIRGLR